jgi:hypothetical protein
MTAKFGADFLNDELKEMVSRALGPYSSEILENLEGAKESYLEEVIPVYERTSSLRSEVDKWYGGGVGEKNPVGWITELMHVTTTMMVPEFARSEFSTEMIAETEAKDQCCNLQLRNIISQTTDIPLPVLAPAVIDDETGEIEEVHDLISEVDGSARLNSFGRAAILGLMEMGHEMPEHLSSLMNPVYGME